MESTETTFRDSCHISERDRRNQRRVILWSAIWAISFLAASLAIKNEWLTLVASIGAVSVAAAFGIVALLAYRRFLHETDELHRKIELEALALAFGVGVVGGLSYWLLVVGGLAPHSGFSYVFAGMLLTHPAGVLIGRRRYS